jgi:hypothetical protein
MFVVGYIVIKIIDIKILQTIESQIQKDFTDYN